MKYKLIAKITYEYEDEDYPIKKLEEEIKNEFETEIYEDGTIVNFEILEIKKDS